MAAARFGWLNSWQSRRKHSIQLREMRKRERGLGNIFGSHLYTLVYNWNKLNKSFQNSFHQQLLVEISSRYKTPPLAVALLPLHLYWVVVQQLCLLFFIVLRCSSLYIPTHSSSPLFPPSARLIFSAVLAVKNEGDIYTR